jgi:hypothetical protein
MDWIKVLNKHVLSEYDDLRDSEFRAWITIMALTAELEHEPTRKQILKHVNYQTLNSLSLKLHDHSIDLPSIIHKVLMDVSYVVHRAQEWKENSLKYRERKRLEKLGVIETSLIKKEKEKEKDIKTYRGFHPPSLSEVSAYCLERKNTVNAQTFINHYESNGWMVGKNKMKDWKAAVRNWETREGSTHVGIRTNRSDPRDTALQSRTDAEVAAHLAKWEAAKKSAGDQTGGATGNDDAPNFSE